MNVICSDKSLLLLGSGFSSFVGGSLFGSFGLDTVVKVKFRVLITNWLDQIFSSEIFYQSSSNGTTNLEFFAKDGSGDAKNLWDFLDHSFVLLFIEENGIVKLLLYLNLGP